eukprot:TRINITY_DN1760_c0_g1_i3.p1 TRINITY_DN1760_c0_g1~~TRINITY_DN1760_c0_g1_i3.p1  ORF type:complete len:510 (-),score=180.23 TRINITY_DN1760_c0_g1_i3:48-1577(-)
MPSFSEEEEVVETKPGKRTQAEASKAKPAAVKKANVADTKKVVKQAVKVEVKKVAKGKDKEAAKEPDSDEEAEPVKLIASKKSKMATKAAQKKEEEEDGDDIGLPDSDEDEPKPAPKKEVKKAPVKKEIAKKTPAKKETAKAAKPAPKKEEPKKDVKPKPKPVAKKEVKKQVKEVEEESLSSIDISDEEDEPVPKKQVQAKKQVPIKKEAKKEAKPIKKPAKPVQQEPEEEEDTEKLEEDNNNKEDNEEVNEDGEEDGEEGNGEAEGEEEMQEEVKKPSKKEAKKEEGEREVFIGNLPFTVTEAEVNEFFAYYGPIESVQLTKRNGRPSGTGFIKFENAETAAKAVAESGQYLQNRSIKVHYASDNPALKEASQGSTTIFVGGLSYNSTQETVSQFFSECGNVIRVRIATDPSGNPKGFAHVEFDTEEAVQNALQLAGQTLDGRRIRIDVAAARSEKSPGGFPPRTGQRPAAPFGAPQRNFPMKSATGNEAAVRNKGLIQAFQGKKKKL